MIIAAAAAVVVTPKLLLTSLLPLPQPPAKGIVIALLIRVKSNN